MSKMREVTIKSTSTNASDHESNLDALLEDLHTSVSRSNSSTNINGGGSVTMGYRSVRRTMTDGTPEGTRSEYHVEYLDPANTIQHVTESSYHSGNLNNHSMDKSNANRSVNESYKYRSEMSGGDSRTKKNISELDSLLDDLNVAQKKSFASNSTVSTMNTTSGFDTGLLEPVSSTPHSTRAYEKRYREEKTVRRERSSSPRRELVFTGTRSRDPSPIDNHHTSYEQREQTPTVQQFYRYEKTTSTRTTAPVVTTEVLGGNDSSRLYTSDTPLAIKQRPPSPSGPQYTQTDGYGKTSSYNYSSSSMREARSDHRTTSPHRPQSPVSFQQPLQPSLSKNRSFRDHSPPPPPRSLSPQRFSPSDPSHRSPYTPAQQSTISSYKYSNTTSTNNYRDDSLTRPRPFPTDSPQEQQPPKQLEELLATLSGSDSTHDQFSREYSRHHQQTTVEHNGHRTTNDLQKPLTPVPPPQPQVPEPHNYREEVRENTVVRKEVGPNQKTDVTQSLTGPPVYYPPGVELFSKKEEEALMQQRSGGMYKAKAKYEYEAKSKSKSKESSGKVVVPVCLPLCCGAPCSIM